MPYADQVDAGPAREHVRELLAEGMTISQIQFASGVNRTSIRVMLGDFPNRVASSQIQHGTAEALLRVRANRGASIAGLVPSVGTNRRLQALVAIGYTKRDLAQRLGGQRMLQIGKRELIQAGRAQDVMALYDELHETPGPSNRAREFARCRGWLPPIWWDDDTIDDPLHVPEGLQTYRQAGRVLVDDVSLPRPVRVRRLHDKGFSPEEIAERIGTRLRYVHRDLLATR